MTKRDGSCHDSSNPSLGASVQPILSFWKDPAQVSPLSLLEDPLLLNSCLQAQKAGRPWKQAPELRSHLLSLASGTKSPTLFPASQYFPCSFFDWWWSSNSSSRPWNPYKFLLQLISCFSNVIPFLSMDFSPSSVFCPHIHLLYTCLPSELSLHSLLPQARLGTQTLDWDAAKIPGFESIC